MEIQLHHKNSLRLFLLAATLVKPCTYPSVLNKKISSVSLISNHHHIIEFSWFWFKCENYLFKKSYTHVAVISAYFESKLPRSRTSKLTRIQNICIIMNYRLVSTFGSGSCVSSFGSSPKVETASVSSFGLTQKWKLQTRFQFWAVSTFVPAQRSLMKKVKALLGTVLGKETYERLNGWKTRTSVHWIPGNEYAQGLTNKFAKRPT